MLKLWFGIFADFPIRGEKELFKISTKDYFSWLFGSNSTCTKYTSQLTAFVAAQSDTAPVSKILSGFGHITLNEEGGNMENTNNKWIHHIKNWLKEKNVPITLNTRVSNIIVENNGVVSFDLPNTRIDVNSGDHVAL